jgi:hypothetical protein
MTVDCVDQDGERDSIEVEVARARRPAITLRFYERGAFTVHLDENHAAALVLALQAAIAEVQARAVSL